MFFILNVFSLFIYIIREEKSWASVAQNVRKESSREGRVSLPKIQIQLLNLLLVLLVAYFVQIQSSSLFLQMLLRMKEKKIRLLLMLQRKKRKRKTQIIRLIWRESSVPRQIKSKIIPFSAHFQEGCGTVYMHKGCGCT